MSSEMEIAFRVDHMPASSGIYKLVHGPSASTYVGQSRNLWERAKQHRQGILKQNHDSQAIRELAERSIASEWSIEVVELCDDDRLDEREAFWIGELAASLNASPGRIAGQDGYIGIRIDVTREINDCLEQWAKDENRTKREHVLYIVRKLVQTYAKDPLILERLAFHRAGEAKLVPTAAA